ncbi:hypothetical protein J6590_102536, partial [Homalodisca vitripennis]
MFKVLSTGSPNSCQGCSALQRTAQVLQYVSTLCLADSGSHHPTIQRDQVQVSPSR